MGISQLYKRLIKPDAYQKEAHAALKRARRLEGEERSRTLGQDFDAFARSFAEDAAAGPVLELAQAVNRASGKVRADALRETAFQVLADGVENTGPCLASVGLQLLEAAQVPRQDRASALKGLVAVVGRRASEAAGVTALALSGAAATGSPEAGLQATLSALAAGGAPLASAALTMVTQTPYADRGAVAQAVLTELAASGTEPLAELAVAAFTSTSDEETRSAVAREALDLLEARPRPGLGVVAARLVKKARAERDQQGAWIDGKTPVALAALDFVGRRAPEPVARELLAATAAACRTMTFTASVAGVAGAALEASDQPLNDAALGTALAAMVGAAESATAGEKYHDDQSKVARAGASLLARAGAREDTRRLGTLTAAVLAPGKFTSSNVEIARVGFGAVTRGVRADDAGLASTVRQMVNAATDSKTTGGAYQFDKNTVAEAAIPVLEQMLAQADNLHAVRLWKAVSPTTTFSTSREQLALASLDAIVTGQTEPGALAARLVESATSGTKPDGSSVDDQLAVARAAAAQLQGKQAELLASVLEGEKFSQSNLAVARAGFAAITAGRGDSDAELALTLHEMIAGALDSHDVKGTFRADKVAVAQQGRVFLKTAAQSPGAQQVLEMWQRAAAGTRFAPSSESLALLALAALSEGKPTDQDLGTLAAAMVKGATSSTDTEGTYHDDKRAVAEALARSLQDVGGPEARVAGEFYLKSVDGTAFRETRHAVAEAVFGALGNGAGTTPAELGATSLQAIDAAYATQASDGQYHDDKSVVARNLLELARTNPASGEQDRRLAALALRALASCQFTPSAVAVAKVALGRQGASERAAEVAAACVEMIKSGAVTSEKQDQGPIAVALFTALAESSPEGPGQSLHAVLAGMMNTGASHLERVKVAEAGLTIWGGGERPDVRPLAERVLAAVEGAEDRRKMLVGACRGLASPAQSGRLEQALAAGPGEPELFELLADLAPGTREQVAELAQALKARGEGEIKIEEDSVWISDFELSVNEEN